MEVPSSSSKSSSEVNRNTEFLLSQLRQEHMGASPNQYQYQYREQQQQQQQQQQYLSVGDDSVNLEAGCDGMLSLEGDDWLLTHTRARLYTKLDEACEFYFSLSERESSLEKEVFGGFVQFLSCIYILPVVSGQLEVAGYHRLTTAIATATVCGIGCILSSYTTNLPFIVAPPTSVSIFLSVSVQRNRQSRQQADTAVLLSGLCLLLIGVFRTASRFVTKLIPDSIQASTSVGIGLITALAGCIEIGLVVGGDYTLLAMGELTPAIAIAGISLLAIGVSQHFHFKGSFVLGLAVGSLLWWAYDPRNLPSGIAAFPTYDFDQGFSIDKATVFLVFNLVFLYVLTLNGLARSLSDLAGITNASGSIPKANWLFIICGVTTILSGLISGPPILISPESAAGIKAGARTGLSTLIAGFLFFVATFFAPFFSQIPASGTSPLLLLVGMVLFQNVSRINWAQPREGISAFFVLLLIPFTYSIICGITIGYIVFVSIGICTGDAWEDAKSLIEFYRLNYFLIPSTGEDSLFVNGEVASTEGATMTSSPGSCDVSVSDKMSVYVSSVTSVYNTSTEDELPPDTSRSRRSQSSLSRRSSLDADSGQGGVGVGVGVGARRRAGSILEMVDRIPGMDLDNSIKPMIS